MTIAEVVAEIQDRADDLTGVPMDPLEALIEKMVAVAAKSRTSVISLDFNRDKRFTAEERGLITEAVLERAQRRQGGKASKQAEKARRLEITKDENGRFWVAPKDGVGAKHGPYVTRKEATKKREGILAGAEQKVAEVQASLAEAVATGEQVASSNKPDSEVESHPNVFRRSAKDGDKAGWWFCALVGSKNQEFGPYDTKAEANEARVSFKRNSVEACEKAGAPITTDKPKASRKAAKQETQASEPTAADAGPSNDAPQATTDREDQTVKTKTKKGDRKQAAAKATKGSSPKAASKKSEGKMSALDAAAEVLKGRSKAMSAKELIELIAERGLWKSPGGATPDATLSAAIGREIAGKGKESRFVKPEPGRFLHS